MAEKSGIWNPWEIPESFLKSPDNHLNQGENDREIYFALLKEYRKYKITFRKNLQFDQTLEDASM